MYELHTAASFLRRAVPQLIKAFPIFYGTQRFTTVFTTACHMSLSSARSIQSTPLIHFNTILPSMYIDGRTVLKWIRGVDWIDLAEDRDM